MKTSHDCPNCKDEKLHIREACCSDKKKGWIAIKYCEKCGYKERFI